MLTRFSALQAMAGQLAEVRRLYGDITAWAPPLAVRMGGGGRGRQSESYPRLKTLGQGSARLGAARAACGRLQAGGQGA